MTGRRCPHHIFPVNSCIFKIFIHALIPLFRDQRYVFCPSVRQISLRSKGISQGFQLFFNLRPRPVIKIYCLFNRCKRRCADFNLASRLQSNQYVITFQRNHRPILHMLFGIIWGQRLHQAGDTFFSVKSHRFMIFPVQYKMLYFQADAKCALRLAALQKILFQNSL